MELKYFCLGGFWSRAFTNTKGAITMSNAQWQARKEQVLARGMANMAAVYIDKAKNAELWDIEASVIDFAAGIAVVNRPPASQGAERRRRADRTLLP